MSTVPDFSGRLSQAALRKEEKRQAVLLAERQAAREALLRGERKARRTDDELCEAARVTLAARRAAAVDPPVARVPTLPLATATVNYPTPSLLERAWLGQGPLAADRLMALADRRDRAACARDTAQGWSEHDPEAWEAAEDRLHRARVAAQEKMAELRERFGVTPGQRRALFARVVAERCRNTLTLAGLDAPAAAVAPLGRHGARQRQGSRARGAGRPAGRRTRRSSSSSDDGPGGSDGPGDAGHHWGTGA